MRSGFLYKLLNLIGTPDENRTHNCPLGGDCYIHLTTEAYFFVSGLSLR